MKKSKIIIFLLILISLLALIMGIYGYKHFWFSKYDKIIINDDKTISLGIIFNSNLKGEVVNIPDNYRGYKVNDVHVASSGITKIVMPKDMEYFDIQACPQLEEITMPENFDCDQTYIGPSHKTRVTLIVKENSKAKQYAIDNGYQYRIEE